jgi:hypothetical protein
MVGLALEGQRDEDLAELFYKAVVAPQVAVAARGGRLEADAGQLALREVGPQRGRQVVGAENEALGVGFHPHAQMRQAAEHQFLHGLHIADGLVHLGQGGGDFLAVHALLGKDAAQVASSTAPSTGLSWPKISTALTSGQAARSGPPALRAAPAGWGSRAGRSGARR